MPTPSSVSRYRPAVLVLTGAAAAYATWLLYTTFSGALPEGLHRSNAVRRPNTRTRPRPRNRAQSQHASRVLEQLLAETTPLGEFDFFGRTITFEAGNFVDHDSLLALGRELQPDASDEAIETRIDEAYSFYVDRYLEALARGRPLSELPTAELEAIVSALNEQSICKSEHARTQRYPGYAGRRLRTDSFTGPGMSHAFPRGGNRTSVLDAQAQPVDDLETIPPTEAGDWEEDIVGDAEGQTLQRTLYHIAEERARHEGVVHRGITCNGCDSKPIRGIRWHCANCADFDLCSDCEATNSHIKTHIFYKIRVPAPNLSITKQEPLYPGRPHMMSPSVDAKLKRRLVSDTRMEAEEIEALWDQFTCLATTLWTTDPNELGWALDRRAFNHAFIPRYSTFKSAPNLIYDRVFSYFDTDHNTLIGFEEFVKGIDSLHATDTQVKLRIVFNGYDIDGDGYISRKDVLRVFRAHYAIEREATRNYLAESAEEISVRGALDVIQSAQPLGSAFTQAAIEPGESNSLLWTKPSDDEVDTAPIIENRPDTLDRDKVIASTNPRPTSQDGLEDSQMVTENILKDRWARRQFYTDEEEGFTQPQGAPDGPATPSYDNQPNGFQDETAIEEEVCISHSRIGTSEVVSIFF
jgi:Ca2+-binding EF-hand superfamily protein